MSERHLAEPIAFARARELYRHAAFTGYPVDTFRLCITDHEAYELLDNMAMTMRLCPDGHAQLVADICRAKRYGDPWSVLREFKLMGMDVVRAEWQLH